jgi:hypothetical protein
MSTTPTTVIDVSVPGDHPLAIRAVALGGAQDVGALDKLNLDGVAETIKSIADTLGGAIQTASPKKASVEFGLEVAVKGGKLVSLITEVGGTATLKVTLEWGG